MKTKLLTLIILAGDPKCHDTAYGTTSYLDIALDLGRSLFFNKVVVVVAESVNLPLGFIRAEPGKTAFESLENGMKLCETEYALILASDLKSTYPALAEFYQAIREPLKHPVYCGVSRLQKCREIKAGVRFHLWCRFGFVRFASTYIVKRDWFWENKLLAEQILADRKSLSGVAKHFLGYLFKECLQTLRLHHFPRLPHLIEVDPCLAVDYDLPKSS